MNGKYQPGQKVFLTGGNKNLIKEATVLKYTGGFYTIRRFETPYSQDLFMQYSSYCHMGSCVNVSVEELAREKTLSEIVGLMR